MEYLESKIPGRELVIQGVMGIPSRSVTFTPDGGFRTTTNPGVFEFWDAATGVNFSTGVGTSENFRRIGHSLLALIVAWVGGRISALLFVRSSGGD